MMMRKFAVGLVLVMALFVAREASAVPIRTDLDAFAPPLGAPLAVSVDTFTTLGGTVIGDMRDSVYQIGGLYLYVHEVQPTLGNTFLLHSGFRVPGFTGTAGWRFGDALGAGGLGDDSDFSVNFTNQVLRWSPNFTWDTQPINLFFVSTKGPTLDDYVLYSIEQNPHFNVNVGIAQSLAPVPEPGSLALLGSGVVGLYSIVRRRRVQKR
jgi:hypothetical protein